MTHARTWSLEHGVLAIDDDVRGRGRHEVDVFFHFAPGLRPERTDGATWSIDRNIRMETDPALDWKLRAGTYHPAMGVREPAWVLVGRVAQALPLRVTTRISWSAPTR